MTTSRLPFALFAAVAASSAFATATPAQVPEGFAVVGSNYHTNFPGPSGLFLVDLASGAVTPITGLPPALTLQADFEGPWSVALRSSDGAVIVGQASFGAVHAYVLHLNGTAVASTETIYLGTPGPGSLGRARVVVLPSDLIYVSESIQDGVFASGPLSSTGHGFIATSSAPPTFIPLPALSMFPLTQNWESTGAVIDPTGTRIYQMFNTYGSPGSTDLLSFDFSTLAWCSIADWQGTTGFGLAIDDDGSLYAGAMDVVNLEHFIHTIRPNGCGNPAQITTVQSSTWLPNWCFDLDRRSGTFVMSTFAQPWTGLSRIDPTTGQVTAITTGSVWSGLGQQGIAINNGIRSYGTVSDGQNRYWFDNFPNPGGQPTVGNTGFSLTMAAEPNPALLSFLALSLGRSSLPLLGVEILVDPASAVLLSVPTGLSVPHAMPIPNDASLAGVLLTAQSLHLEAGGFASSRGLEFSIRLLPAPTITSITPAAPLAGATVTVTGSHFESGMELQVAGNLTAIVTQSAGSLTFVMPLGVQCNSTISLTNVGGSSTTTPINGSPVITSMPANGPAAGGAFFVLSGQNLAEATVTFNGVPLTNIIAQGPTAIAGYTPAGTAGPATVVVTGPTGCQTNAPYIYL